ncbi:hypothetical protein CLM62_29890 [Streptomyces sp. SA15]|uniref:hypothetical protein n=1 Tax=Streptomyces sp. SA15 TaxID=934019 RepID=UPI000BAE793D|nr:hypothetical protein [Streptomyces sp. SA15]PAZ12405.1 hypothetical protein CLM62_29890 [Streptomyces sp. SA15]
MAEYEGGPAADALLAAILDEALPDRVQGDPEFMAEHRSAAADVALLREQLTLIGDTLAGGERAAEPAPAPAAASRNRTRRSARAPRNRRPLALALGTLAAACAAALVVGMGWLVAQGGMSGSDSGAGTQSAADGGAKEEAAGRGSAGYLACARLVVEGTVTEVEPLPGAVQDRITLEVERYYKPDKGKDEVTFLMAKDAHPRLGEGDHALIGIPRDAATPDIWTTGEEDIARERRWITKALPEARTLDCETE